MKKKPKHKAATTKTVTNKKPPKRNEGLNSEWVMFSQLSSGSAGTMCEWYFCSLGERELTYSVHRCRRKAIAFIWILICVFHFLGLFSVVYYLSLIK